MSQHALAAARPRKGARRMCDVPAPVLAQLAAGAEETVNLMEWLATDMSALARAVAAGLSESRIRAALEQAADEMGGRGVTDRLRLAGDALAGADPHLSSADYALLRSHRSDLVRQWACYAISSPKRALSADDRLSATLSFAADANMSVREAAWMAFRPYVAAKLDWALSALEPLTRHDNPNIRRFAIEVTRPRSVWGAHIETLKRDPELARSLLENTRCDASRYVQLAVGNWLNDASKTRPDWTAQVCRVWKALGDPHSNFIARRGERTLIRSASSDLSLRELF
jgi:3-methyladenine DNA glycosylase AlkC